MQISGDMSQSAFPREVRLTNKSEYQQVFAGATAVRDRHFTVLVCASESTSARLGMVVAKKKAKRAVDRHRIKRIVRESFRNARVNLPVVDIIVLSQASAASASSDQLFKSLDKIWIKMRRISEKDGISTKN